MFVYISKPSSNFPSGEGGWFVIYRLFKFICILLIHALQNNVILYLLIFYFDYVVRCCRNFFILCSLSFFPYSRLSSYQISLLLTFFVSLIVLFHYCCSHARVFGKTLVHEFPISYSHTEWYFIFSLFGARETKHAQRILLCALFLKWLFKLFH